MLFFPTSGLHRVTDALTQPVARGQLYNLDRDEYLGFQFNPENFEWEKEWKWADAAYRGRSRGRDQYFITQEPTEFDLPLLYMSDPAAPNFSHAPNYRIRDAAGAVDFTELLRLFDNWQLVRPGLRRPSRLMVMFSVMPEPFVGPLRTLTFEGIITKVRPRILEKFESGAIREGMIQLSFKEWVPYGLYAV